MSDTNIPNHFEVQVQADDDPTATSGWVTVATASDIFGYDRPTNNRVNAGRRVVFDPVQKRYLRWINRNPVTDDDNGLATFAEIQIGRQVIIVDSGDRGDTNYPLNAVTDGNPATFVNENDATGGSGNFVLDVLVPEGEGVAAIMLQRRDAGGGACSPVASRSM